LAFQRLIIQKKSLGSRRSILRGRAGIPGEASGCVQAGVLLLPRPYRNNWIGSTYEHHARAETSREGTHRPRVDPLHERCWVSGLQKL